jgi:hypothetical protein
MAINRERIEGLKKRIADLMGKIWPGFLIMRLIQTALASILVRTEVSDGEQFEIL